MKIRKATIVNVRSIEKLEWQPPQDRLAGWHVILGDNGSGKSSVLRSIALALIGPREGIAARQDWNDWVRFTGDDFEEASISIEFSADEDYDFFSKAGRTGKQKTFFAGVEISREDFVPTLVKIPSKGMSADRSLWGSGEGWFSAAYGPFRRFAGGDRDADRIFFSNPRLGAHISVFGESIALTESLLWLQELNYQRLEDRPEGALIRFLTTFVNQDNFLPFGVKLGEVSSRGVVFRDASENYISVEQLSDGYRSILSMTFELIRQLCRTFSYDRVFSKDGTKIVAPGVVLIDEIDAHLHPSWQKRIGWWLTHHFPNIQFIVTTHSPLICQAAVNGSIYRLPLPGTGEKGGLVDGTELKRLLYGDILEAYSTEAFGVSETRSEDGQQKQDRLVELNTKEIFSSLSSGEKAEQRGLQAIFADDPSIREEEGTE